MAIVGHTALLEAERFCEKTGSLAFRQRQNQTRDTNRYSRNKRNFKEIKQENKIATSEEQASS
jgi:hypothetical protein